MEIMESLVLTGNRCGRSLAWPDRFFSFFFGVAEKGSGLVWFTVATRLGTFEV